MKIFIIVLHFGDPKITLNCIKSIFASKLDFAELVVVDNNQNFDALNFKSRIGILRNKKNLGFAGGVNVGIKHALARGADYVLLLNNDTIVRQNFLNTLVKFGEQFENAGILGPAIKFRKDGKFVYDVGGKLNRIFGRTTHEEVYKILSKKPRIADYISGCTMLIKKDVFEKAGLFDDRFFLYYEDVDFCIRAKSKGFLTYVLPEVSIEHELSKSVGKDSAAAVYNQTKSALQFGKKHFSKTVIFNRFFIIAQSIYIFMKNPKIGVHAILAFRYL